MRRRKDQGFFLLPSRKKERPLRQPLEEKWGMKLGSCGEGGFLGGGGRTWLCTRRKKHEPVNFSCPA